MCTQTNFRQQCSTQVWFAKKQLYSSKTSLFARFVQGVSVVSIAISVFVLIVVLSIFNGFRDKLEHILTTLEPHAIIQVSTAEPKDIQSWLNAQLLLKKVTPTIQSYALLLSQPPLPLIVASRNELFETEIVQPSSTSSILPVQMEQQAAINLGLEQGDTFSIAALTPDHRSVNLRCQLSSVIPSTSNIITSYTLFTNPRLLAKKLGLTSESVTHYALTLKQSSSIDAFRKELEQRYPFAQFIDQSQQARLMSESLTLQKRMMFIVLALIVAMGSFNLTTSLMMMVREKAAEIALLKTLGMNQVQIKRTITLQGFLLALLGLTIGIASGVPTARSVQRIIETLEWLSGTTLSRSIFMFSDMPTRVSVIDIAAITLVVCTLSLVSVWVPARKASQIQPANTLRYE